MSDAETDLTPEEKVKDRMWQEDYQDTAHWNHSQAVQEVHRLSATAWPDPPSSPSAEAPPPEANTPPPAGPILRPMTLAERREQARARFERERLVQSFLERFLPQSRPTPRDSGSRNAGLCAETVAVMHFRLWALPMAPAPPRRKLEPTTSSINLKAAPRPTVTKEKL